MNNKDELDMHMSVGDTHACRDIGMWTAGIHLPYHGNAIEIHGSSVYEAEARRDHILKLQRNLIAARVINLGLKNDLKNMQDRLKKKDTNPSLLCSIGSMIAGLFKRKIR